MRSIIWAIKHGTDICISTHISAKILKKLTNYKIDSLLGSLSPGKMKTSFGGSRPRLTKWTMDIKIQQPSRGGGTTP